MNQDVEKKGGEPRPPEYVIEGARSGRAKCKSCQRKIQQGSLRLGILIEGPFGEGYLWHHLNCAARRQLERVEEAYAQEAWKHAKEPPAKVPSLDSLRAMQQKAEEQKRERPSLPYAELAPTGRAKCKHCGEPIAEGSARIVIGREVEFGRQLRTSAIKVHPGCVAEALQADDSATEAEGFADAIRAHSNDLSSDQISAILSQVGDLG